MKKKLLSLFLACLLLSGCAGNALTDNTSPILPFGESPVRFTEPAGTYDAGSAIEASTQGAVRAYPLYRPMTAGLKVMGEALLVFSGEDTTTLTLLSGEDLYPAATATLDFWLDPNDPSVCIHETELSYFDPVRRETVVLDQTLTRVCRIAAPEDLSGSPILSQDRKTLYYCSPTAVCLWDLETGIRRRVKEMSYPEQSVTALHCGGSVLACRVSDEKGVRSMYLDTATGRLLQERDGNIALCTYADRYYAAFPTGTAQSLLFGETGGKPQALVPEDISASYFFLEQSHAAVTVSAPSGNGIYLDYYDLETGLRSARLTLQTQYSPTVIEDTADGFLYILVYDHSYGCETIYRWDPAASAVTDAAVYTGVYYTKENPDIAGLADCQRFAAELGEKYGINILVYEDAAAIQPWDYDMEPEYLVPVIRHELEQLDIRLSHYPEGFLQTLAQRFDGLNICLVRSITGTAESGSLNNAVGLQFWEGHTAYIGLAAGENAEQALYHELCHLIDTIVLNESIAYDQWYKLNPEGFSYDYDYAANQNRDGSQYLQDETRSFIDTYSMSFEKEDRARIMEYAMTPGNEDMFQSMYMQAKLRQLCLGIRDAFALERSSADFLWEQYLHAPLAYME